ncbi:MAG: glycosyltransferase family 4 protein [Anaerolineae bacterium]
MAEAAPEMALTVVVPPYWRDERGRSDLEHTYTDGYELSVQHMAFNGAFHLHFYPRLRAVIDAARPDLVHIDEEPYNLATYHANKLARRTGAKTLWFSWQNLYRRYPPPFSWIERYNLTHIDHAIVGSQTAAEIWRAKGYEGPLSVIPQFGVDADVFHPGSEEDRDGIMHIAYVGRFVAEKGVDLLLAALSQLQGDWRATLLGSGPAEAALREQTTALGLTKQVTFRPWLPSTQMPAFYRKVDVLVLPSRTRPNWTEQFGRVLIEAMASGVAVVGSRAGEIPHVIGEAGLLFGEDDADELRHCLNEISRQPALRRELGAQGRARVLGHFTQQRIADATLDVYRQVLR